ncbi:MurR/RpiR family transcriptional regulator [Vagococcus xieshaowenii]|uniref:MurR/RpiR family transcriptional regulator n=1 Tax=Vagococcus xieshaowenii TaxID=2562451 RepID=A0AAJ5EDZ3_9ENTE|nr:MurR/RpiR family transcriptional regulator [Vagococcus xieshaowenii]QCA27907.1 MurR/RpiR family transcriptional regulator [Vagococcus xieshaowenii]TFZ39414.1 MurR/RpiR family transcriptional regulator [Vagococcus xieshaowenii]
MEYVNKIKEYYEILTKSEKKVADYILSQGEKLIYTTMGEVKAQTGVGDATIVRFCQKIGYSGFSELKIDIAKEDFSQMKEQEQVADLFEHAARQLVTAIDETKHSFEMDKIDEVSQLIVSARHVYIYGVGASGQSGLDLERMLIKVGIPSTAIIDSHYQAQSATIVTPQDVVIVFSLSGKTKDTFDTVKIAKDKGANIVVITSYGLSPIAQLADVVLKTAIEEHLLNGGSLAGRISQLFLSDVLVRNIEDKFATGKEDLRAEVLRSVMNKMI